jgi:hypothetical protein
LPYSYSDLLTDLEEAKESLMHYAEEVDYTPIQDSPDPNNKPVFKVLNKKDYLDAAKYKHFSQY